MRGAVVMDFQGACKHLNDLAIRSLFVPSVAMISRPRNANLAVMEETSRAMAQRIGLKRATIEALTQGDALIGIFFKMPPLLKRLKGRSKMAQRKLCRRYFERGRMMRRINSIQIEFEKRTLAGDGTGLVPVGCAAPVGPGR